VGTHRRLQRRRCPSPRQVPLARLSNASKMVAYASHPPPPPGLPFRGRSNAGRRSPPTPANRGWRVPAWWGSLDTGWVSPRALTRWVFSAIAGSLPSEFGQRALPFLLRIGPPRVGVQVQPHLRACPLRAGLGHRAGVADRAVEAVPVDGERSPRRAVATSCRGRQTPRTRPSAPRFRPGGTRRWALSRREPFRQPGQA
jgi:hypothetical protein